MTTTTHTVTDPVLEMRTLLCDDAIIRDIQSLYDLLGDAQDILVDDEAMTLLQGGINNIVAFVARRHQVLEGLLWQITSERNQMASTILEQEAHITDLLFGDKA